MTGEAFAGLKVVIIVAGTAVDSLNNNFLANAIGHLVVAGAVDTDCTIGAPLARNITLLAL